MSGAISIVGQGPVIAALDAAATACERSDDWQGAVEMLAVAADLMRARNDRRADDLDLRRAAALYRMGQYEDAMAVCRVVATSARTLDNPALLAASALVVRGIDDREICSELLRNINEAAPGLAPDSAIFARAVAHKIVLEAQLNRRPADEGRASEALALAERTRDHRAIIEALHAVELSLQGPRKVHKRLQVAERMQRLSEQAHLDDHLRWPLSWRVDGLWLLGDRPAFDEAVDRLEEYGEARNDALAKWKAASVRASLAMVAGKFADAHVLADRALELARVGNHRSAIFIDAIVRSHLASRTARVRTDLVRVGDFPQGGEVFAIFAAMDAATRRDLDVAAVLFDRSWPHIDQVVDHELDLSFYWAFAKTIEALQLTAPASQLYRRMAPFADMLAVGSSGVAASPGCISRYLGEMAALTADWAAMEEDFARALRRDIEFGDRPNVAETRYGWARAVLRRGQARDVERAEAMIDAALREAQELAMAPMVREIEALQEGLHVRPRHSLSPRELEVARLVAQGHSNKQMAASMRISVRTVESHLLKVMSKVGLENRAQVAAWVTRTAEPD